MVEMTASELVSEINHYHINELHIFQDILYLFYIHLSDRYSKQVTWAGLGTG